MDIELYKREEKIKEIGALVAVLATPLASIASQQIAQTALTKLLKDLYE